MRCGFVCLCGHVTGVGGAVSGVEIDYVVRSRSGREVQRTTRTNAQGRYCIEVPEGSSVFIEPSLGLGVDPTPRNYDISRVFRDACDLDFNLSPVVAGIAISGTVSGLGNNAGVMISYSVGGVAQTPVLTDALGMYTISVPVGSNVLITPDMRLGFSVNPTSRTLNAVTTPATGQDFVYTLLVP